MPCGLEEGLAAAKLMPIRLALDQVLVARGGSRSPTPSPSPTRPRPTAISPTRSAPHETLDFVTPLSVYLAEPAPSNLFELESGQDS